MSSEILDRDYEGKLLALHRHAQQLASATTLDEIINHTLDAMDRALGFSSADFSIVDTGKRCLQVRGRLGSSLSFSELSLDGPGISVKTANTGKTLLIADTRREEAYVDDEGRAGKEASPDNLSELAVPVILDHAVVAVLNVENDSPNAFTNIDQNLLETLASHVASSFGRLQRDETLRRRAEELTALQATVLELTASHDLQKLLNAIVARAADLLRAPSGGLYICDTERREVRCTVSYNTPKDFTGTVLKYGEGAAGYVAQTGEPLVVDDYRSWTGRAGIFEKDQPFTAVLSTPMIWQGKVTGVIEVLDDTRSRRFTDADLRLLQLFANHAAIALENESTLERLRRRGEELAALQATVLDIINAPYDLPTLLEAIVERAVRLLGAQGGGLDLCDSEKREMRCAVSYNTPRDFGGLVLKYGEGASGRVAETGKPLIIDDYRKWEGAARVDGVTDLGAVLSAPMIWQGQVTGVIQVIEESATRKFTQQDLDLLTLFANHAAIAIENQRSLETLEESNRFNKEIVAQASEGVIVYDRELNYVVWNRFMQELTGMPGDKVVGRNAFGVFPFLREGGIDLLLRRALEGETVTSNDTAFHVHETGRTGWFSGTYGPHYDAGGNIIGAIGFVRDITERKRTEDSLRESEERFRQAMEATNDGLWDVNVETGEVYVSPAYYHILGYEADEFPGLGKSWMDLVHPDDRDSLLRNNQDCIENRIPDFKIEFRMRTKSGAWKWILDRGRASARDADGRALRMIGTHQDITERKKAEDALRASEVKYRTLFERIPQAIYQTNPKGEQLTANPALVHLLGYDSEKELSAVNAERDFYVNPEDRRKWATDLEKTGEVRNAELLLKRKDGSKLIVLDNAHAVHDDQGTLLYYEGTLTDITERKRMQDALRESEERYRLLFEKSPVGIGLSTLDGQAVSMNDSMQTITGYSNEEFQKIKIDETYENPQDRKKMLEMLERDGSFANYQVRLIRKDGTPYDALLNVSRVQFGGKDFVQTACIDITERRRMEARLGSLHEHTLRLSSAKGLDEIVKYTLDAMKFTLGYDFCDFNVAEGDLLVCRGSTQTGELPPVRYDGPGIVSNAARELVTVRVGDTRKEPTYLDRSGAEWTGPPTMLSELATPVIIENKAVAVLNVEKAQPNSFTEQDQELLETLASHVASALHRLSQEEKIREHSERMEELVEVRTKELRAAERLAAIGELATMVAHDLRNPLQGIATATYNLKKHSGKRIDKVSKEMYQIIDQDIRHSDRILRELLEYSKEVHLDIEKTDAQATTKSALAHVKIPKRIHVVNSTKNQPKLMADAEKMRRVLVNLIENAIDAMPRRGRLTIESRESDGGVEITISDTGTGMSKETLERIWNPLFTTKARGIGLGLPIAKRLVEAQGGSVAVQSTQGAGSTFTIRMPKVPIMNEGRA